MAYYPLKIKDNGGNTHTVGDPRTASKADLASPTFTGTPAAPTAAADTNTTQIATTAFVVGQEYAKLASPALTGTPTAPTAAANTNTTQVATTAFVLGQGNSTAATIAMNGTQAAGSSNLYARADHVHPTDTSRAASTHTHTSTAITAVDINSQSASYTLVLADASKLILMTSGSAQTVTIPPNSSVAFPVGTKIDIVQTGAGQCDVAPGAGVTLNSDTSKRKVNVQYAAVSCVKTATDTWLLIGALKA